ncbi:ABC transporter substrate-binding protein [Actinomadura sp. K4S16]|uniref:ABC transporter substrate-binding protein n=1 Tax=Actinomadura sp. K4S16 TaxID=1316147 RepID=UPI0011EDB3CB|nr:ABC transporter substrate-binding protein [Actinomadura sp. K4S16]
MTRLGIGAGARLAAGIASLMVLAVGCGSGGGQEGGGSAAGKPVTVAGVTVGKDSGLHDLLPAEIKDAGTVRVATDVPYPPFEMYTSEGSRQMTGLDYDLGQAIGAKLGVRFAFSAQKFEGLLPAVQAGKFDVVMSAMTDTKERQAVLTFVDYSASGSGILVAKGNPKNITTLTDLCGQPVAVQSGTKQAKMLKDANNPCVQAGKPPVKLSVFPKDTDGQLAIKAGKVVADFMDKPAAGYTAKTADGGAAFQVVDDPQYPNGVDSTPNGIGVTKKNPQLARAIQQALQALMDDGTYTKILELYGQKGIGIPKATMNAGVG